MDATVKCGNAGYGYGYGAYGYGYGNSKPQMNYHRQSTESVTTLVTEINRMSVNDKPGCGGAGAGGVQKQAAYKEEEVFVEQDQGSYGGYHGGGAVQAYTTCEGAAAGVKNHGYKQEKYGEADGGYGSHYGVKKQGYEQEACGQTNAGHGGAHYGGAAGAVQTYAYDQQAAYGVQQHGYQKDAYGGAVKKDSYQQHESYGDCGAGYGGSHYGGGAGVQTNAAYKQHEKYGEADGGYGAYYGGGAGVKKQQGYKQESYGENGAGYGAHHYGGGGVEQHGYNQKHKDAYGGGAVKKSNYQHESYGDCDAGYGSHYGGGAVQKYGYKQDVYGGNAAGGLQHGGAYGYGAHGKAGRTDFAGGYNYNLKAYDSGSESESDCEEHGYGAYKHETHGASKQGGLHGYGAYKYDKHGAGNLGGGGGGVRRYESYEKHEELAGGRRYQSYQSTTQEYTGGGGYGYDTCPPLNNSHLLGYGA